MLHCSLTLYSQYTIKMQSRWSYTGFAMFKLSLLYSSNTMERSSNFRDGVKYLDKIEADGLSAHTVK